MTSAPQPSTSKAANILVLVGSARLGFNDALARAATTFLEEGGHTVHRYPHLSRLPHYSEELDASGGDDSVDHFREAVAASDALLLITPEYNGGPSSLIKNALDVASRPRGSAVIAGKPAAVIGASPSHGGTANARAALKSGLRLAGATPMDLSHGVASSHTRLGDDGYDEEVLARVHEVLAELVLQTQPVEG